MAVKKNRSGLGRGLASLIGEQPAKQPSTQPKQAVATSTPPPLAAEKNVPIEHLVAGRYQPRLDFDEEAIASLADSFRKNGILQPLLVRPLEGTDKSDDTRYEIIAGERRWRAAQVARLEQVPVIIRALDNAQALEIGLIENIQREGLNPLEEAEGFRRLAQEFHYTQADIADIIGQSRSHIANRLRLLDAPQILREHLRAGRLSAGHVRALLGHNNIEQEAQALAQKIIDGGLNVRAAERLAQQTNPRTPKTKAQKSADTQALEKRLSDSLGLATTLTTGKDESGVLEIRYKTLEQLDGVIKKLI